MKRALLFLLALASCGGAVSAAPGGCTNDGTLVPFQFETITVSSTAVGFTSATFQPAGQTPAIMAVVTLATNDVRWRVDGIAPTAAIGHAYAATGALTVCGLQNIQQFKMIRQTSDATASVSYFRTGNN